MIGVFSNWWFRRWFHRKTGPKPIFSLYDLFSLAIVSPFFPYLSFSSPSSELVCSQFHSSFIIFYFFLFLCVPSVCSVVVCVHRVVFGGVGVYRCKFHWESLSFPVRMEMEDYMRGPMCVYSRVCELSPFCMILLELLVWGWKMWWGRGGWSDGVWGG